MRRQSRQQQMEERLAISLEARVCIDLALHHASETVVIDWRGERSGGADSGTQGVGDGHGVVEGGHLLVGGEPPFGGEDEESIGRGRTAGGDLGKLAIVEFPLGGIERHHEDGHAGGEELTGGARIHSNVVFGLRWWRLRSTRVAVTAMDRATHKHYTVEKAETGWVAVDGGPEIGKRTDG